MREATLFEIGSRDLWNSELILSHLTGDEIDLNLASYHIEQALEKCIKFQLEMREVKYKWTQDLSTLVEIKENISNAMPLELKAELGLIIAWESKTRYIKDYFLELRTINRVLPKVKAYLSTVKEKYGDKTVGTRTEDIPADAKPENTTSEFNQIA